MFDVLKKRYEDKRCTEEQLQRYVRLGKLTQKELKKILEVDHAKHEQNA